MNCKHLISTKVMSTSLLHKQLGLNSELFYWMLFGSILLMLVNESSFRSRYKMNEAQIGVGAKSVVV